MKEKGRRVEEPGTKFGMRSSQEGEEEGMGESGDQEEFMARRPSEDSRTLKSQFAFVVTNSHFDLPATGISQNDLPGEERRMSGLGGEQIPGGLTFASGND